METSVIQVAQIWDLEHNPVNGRIYSPDGIAPTLMTPTGGYFEPKILLEMEEIKSCASRKRGDEHKIETRKDELANCVTSIDTDSMVCEPTKVIGSMQEHAYQGSIDGVSPCVNAAAGMGGGHIPMVVEEPQVIQKIGDRGTDNYSIKNISNTIPANPMSDRGQLLVEPQVLTPLRTEDGKELRKQGIEKFSNRALYPREDGVSNTITSVQKDNLLQEPKRRYRIRKLTEREVFRLMDVSEEDIDKIQAAGISKTAQYKLAGNSIVVSCLYHIFRKLFLEPGCEEQQLSLF